MSYVPAEDLTPSAYVRDPGWQDRYATVSDVKRETEHTVRVFWEDGSSCIHPNRARFTVWRESMDRYERGLSVDGSLPKRKGDPTRP